MIPLLPCLVWTMPRSLIRHWQEFESLFQCCCPVTSSYVLEWVWVSSKQWDNKVQIKCWLFLVHIMTRVFYLFICTDLLKPPPPSIIRISLMLTKLHAVNHDMSMFQLVTSCSVLLAVGKIAHLLSFRTWHLVEKRLQCDTPHSGTTVVADFNNHVISSFNTWYRLTLRTTLNAVG
jgi:hypothetical protein